MVNIESCCGCGLPSWIDHMPSTTNAMGKEGGGVFQDRFYCTMCLMYHNSHQPAVFYQTSGLRCCARCRGRGRNYLSQRRGRLPSFVTVILDPSRAQRCFSGYSPDNDGCDYLEHTRSEKLSRHIVPTPKAFFCSHKIIFKQCINIK